MAEPHNHAAADLAGALPTGPGREAPTASTNVAQINPFNSESKRAWHTWMEAREDSSRERLDNKEIQQFIRWLNDEPSWESGINYDDKKQRKADMKKRSWVKENFYVSGNILWRKADKKHPEPRKVLAYTELADVIIETHVRLGHAGHNPTCAAVLKDYYGLVRDEIIELLRRCEICSRKHASKSKAPLINIKSTNIWQRVQMDLVDMRHDPDREWNWILHMEDHFSKFHQLYPMKDKEAPTVAPLIHRWISSFGIMDIMQSDNGNEFKGVCEELLKRYGVKVKNGRPRTPRTQGLVEQANGVVKRRIASWKRTTGLNTWADGLEVSLRTYILIV